MRLRKLSFPAILALTSAGCQGPGETYAILQDITDEASDVQEVEVLSVSGDLDLSIPVRLVNVYGAAIPGDDVNVSVAGQTASTADSAVNIDAIGYGWVDVSTDQPEPIQVTAHSDSYGSSQTVESWATDGDLPLMGLMPAWALANNADAPSDVAAATRGVVALDDDLLWFQPTQPGTPPHRILDAPNTLVGVRTAHLDNDGILDAAAWSATTVFLLRGHENGGMAWGGAFSISDEHLSAHAISDVNIGDIDGDNVLDLAVATNAGTYGAVIVMYGDGIWGFETVEEIEIDAPLTAILLADTDIDGQDELNLLDTNAKLIRYKRTDGTWAETGYSQVDTALSNNAAFLGAFDLNQKGADDLILFDANEGATGSIVWYTMDSGMTRFKLRYPDMSATTGDLNADFVEDLAFISEGNLHHVAWQDETFTERTLASFPTDGVLAVADFDNEDLNELIVANQILRVFPGEENDNGNWTAKEGTWTNFDLGLAGEAIMMDWSGDGLSDIIGLFDNSGTASVRLWRVAVSNGVTSLTVTDTQAIQSSATPIDLAVCGDDVWALAESDTKTKLLHFEVTSSGNASNPESKTVSGDRVVCGDFAAGKAAVILTSDGSVTYYQTDLDQAGTGNVSSAVDVTAGDTNGDGDDEVLTCTETDCSILAVDIGNNGTDEVFISTAETLEVSGWDQMVTYQAGGVLGAGDVDQDGYVDVIASNEDVLWVYRGLKGGLAGPAGLHTRNDVSGVPGVGDAKNNGTTQFFLLGEDGNILQSSGE